MASTIIIKNKNTGAPSTLAAGELAINTTLGSLYYGSTGGTEPLIRRASEFSYLDPDDLTAEDNSVSLRITSSFTSSSIS